MDDDQQRPGSYGSPGTDDTSSGRHSHDGQEGTTGAGAGADDRPKDERSALDKAFDGLRGLGVYRRVDDKWIGGVCSGIADRFGVDPIIVRAGFVLLGLLGGTGVTLYLLAWTLLPDEDGDIAAELAIQHGDTSSIILSVITALVLFSGFPWWWGHSFGLNFPWLLLVVVGLVWWFWSASRGGAPGALSPEEQAARREHVRRRTQEWGARASARGQQFGDRVTARSEEAGKKVAENTRQRDQRRRESRRIARESRRRSGGVVLALITIGLALVAYGTLEWTGPVSGFTGNWDVIALAAALAVFGVVLVLAGLWGRRAGLVGFLAIVLGLVVAAGAATPDNLRFGGRVGSERWTPSVVSDHADYRVMVGDGTIDLTGLPAEGLDGQRLDGSVGIGNLTVVVPDDLTVRVKAHVGAGEVRLPPGYVSNDGQSDTSSGLGVSRDVVIGDGPTEVVLDANVGTGQIRVEQQ